VSAIRDCRSRRLLARGEFGYMTGFSLTIDGGITL
jgi:hypothetical protein